ncbi:MAG: class I SAM-dependent methyltransferase [Elusimicrobia bacterium]|nr:class I SAM-dependent methyltransferase [Elusimicrobiota bacterium]
MDKKAMSELFLCDFCGSRDFKFLFSGHDYLAFSPLTFNVMRCNKCGLVGLKPCPENLVKYYDSYRKDSSEKDIFLFPLLFPNRVKKIKKLKSPGKILDIGCGAGGFLSDMQKEGWAVYGCDLDSNICDTAKNSTGLKNIYTGDVLFLDFPDNFFDVITLWHVLEHLTNPKDTLRKINKLLKDGGILIVESPDFSSIQSKFFKDKWFSLDLPRHIHQFSPKTVKKICNSASLEIFKKDYIINSYINFVSLKKSLLRYIGMDKYLTKKEADKSADSVFGFQKSNIAYKFFLRVFNYGCLFLALLLAVIHCEDSFRVYYRKTGNL